MMKWTLVIFATVLSSSTAQDFGSWCPNIESDFTKCSTDFFSSLTDVKNLLTDISKVFSVQSLFSNASSVCKTSSLTAVLKFYGCVYGKLLACIPGEWRKAFPDVDAAKGSLKYLCENIDDIDIACLSNLTRTEDFEQCLDEGSSGTADVSTVDKYLAYKCRVYPKATTCARTAYGTCQKKTAEVGAKLKDLQKPVGCDACMFRPTPILLVSMLFLWILKERNSI